ncbi:TPA: YraN family protein [bacterium]|nr:YraN family protein [bacterium]
MNRCKLGKRGEKRAADYLQKRGYTILAQNFRTPLGEIDIIAQEKGTIVFIEVKTRSSVVFGQAEEAVNLSKQHQISKVAQIYLKAKGKENQDCRFDVVAVYEGNEKPAIELIKNAFYLGNW